MSTFNPLNCMCYIMAIIILNDPEKKVRPAGAIRGDVAWKLFLPDSMGDVDVGRRKDMNKFTNWLWRELGERLGNLMRRGEDDVYILTPPLSDAARELLVRIASMWSDDVHEIMKPDENTDLGQRGRNLWMGPVVNTLGEDGTPLLTAMKMDHHESDTTFLMPALGSARAFMRTYTIGEGETYARLHSHSAVEEHYLVLEGSGELRYGSHTVRLKKGDLVSKPVGPDNFSQFLGSGGKLKLLDIEIWPDNTGDAKDAVIYPDHGELYLRGEGWSAIIPTESIMGSDDFSHNYDAGYERKADGTWVPKKVPGVPERNK